MEPLFNNPTTTTLCQCVKSRLWAKSQALEQQANKTSSKHKHMKQEYLYISHNTKPFGDHVGPRSTNYEGQFFNVMYWDHDKSTFIPTPPPSCCLKGCLVVWWRCSKQLFKCHDHYGQPIKSSHFFLMILSEISVPCIFTGWNSVSHYLKAKIHPKYYVRTILPFIQNPMSTPFYHSSKILCPHHFTIHPKKYCVQTISLVLAEML